MVITFIEEKENNFYKMSGDRLRRDIVMFIPILLWHFIKLL
jgi:hypothetical protein